MRYGSSRKSAARGDGGSFWISYSDLMSALLLLFVLIMFYSVYQYFDMLETKSAELDDMSASLMAQQAELNDKDAALAAAQIVLGESQKGLEDAQALLQSAQDELTASQEELLIKQAALELAEQKLAESETALDAQRAQVNSAEDALAVSQAQLADALARYEENQAQLDANQAQLDAQQKRLDDLVGVRTEIIDQLVRELSQANITGAKVDDSGAIVFDSDMMFEKNRSVLNDQGKAFLDSFIPSYLRVLMKTENQSFVSQVIVEGHADTDGTFLTNMSLSQARAYAVLAYVLSDEFRGVTYAEKKWLQGIVTVNGRSYSEPVYDETGKYDMDASRRVVIKFRLNDENMVDDMIAVLEGMN